MAKNSRPSSRASFSALGLSSSVTAMILLLISLMSDHGKPWAIEQRQHAVLAFHRRELVDEAAHRLARGVEHADHAAVPGGHHRPGAALDGAFHDGEQIVGALRHVDMRIFLEQHQRGGVAQGALADVAMKVELDADRHVRPDDLAHMGQQVAFAVVVALGHHGAVHRQQHAHRPASRP